MMVLPSALLCSADMIAAVGVVVAVVRCYWRKVEVEFKMRRNPDPASTAAVPVKSPALYSYQKSEVTTAMVVRMRFDTRQSGSTAEECIAYVDSLDGVKRLWKSLK
jgi:hypothetical protein